jgi:hypothetical protein
MREAQDAKQQPAIKKNVFTAMRTVSREEGIACGAGMW